jgi:hypothetical protein
LTLQTSGRHDSLLYISVLLCPSKVSWACQVYRHRRQTPVGHCCGCSSALGGFRGRLFSSFISVSGMSSTTMVSRQGIRLRWTLYLPRPTWAVQWPLAARNSSRGKTVTKLHTQTVVPYLVIPSYSDPQLEDPGLPVSSQIGTFLDIVLPRHVLCTDHYERMIRLSVGSSACCQSWDCARRVLLSLAS